MVHALLVLVALLTSSGRAVEAPPCVAKLRVTQSNTTLTLTGYCHSLLDAPATYRYRLLVRRHGTGGQSQNSQGGTFALAPRQELTLSKVQLNGLSPDSYKAKLLIYDENNTIIAQDSISQ